MALSPKLAIRQTTALVMTPQLQQAIKLLQFSNQELDVFVEAEIECNPLLEREDVDGGIEPGAAPAEPEDGAGDEESETADTADLAAADRLPGDGEAPLDTDYGNVWGDEAAAPGDSPPPAQFANWGGGGSFDWDAHNFEEHTGGAETLREHVTLQANLELHTPEERLMAAALIDSLDETGYIATPIEEIAARLGVAPPQVEAVLTRLQNLDPPGVFARDLAECLALQLKDRDRLDPAMAELLRHLDLLARRDAAALRRLCGVGDEDLADMVAEIRSLNPKPGLAFGAEVVQPVVPDILVRGTPGGGWQVELNADTLPRVLVNQSYYAEVRRSARSRTERAYIADRLQSANWLVRALHQRATTILKVATEIVRAQGGFLAKGVQHLKPLTLRDVADAIGMHESTVSRVTSNKFMATPRGVFELKYFFTFAISSTDGSDPRSAESVRHRIKELIDREGPGAVLSDDKIVAILIAEGTDIARRTVAKYRESMRIPSSVQRRREKAISL